MSRGRPPAWLVFAAARWKAMAATVLPLIGGLLYLISTDEFDLKHVAGVLAIALGAGGVVHQVPNQVLGTATDTVGTVLDTAENTVGKITDVLLPGDQNNERRER